MAKPLPSIWTLLKASWQIWITNFIRISRIILIIALPVSLLTLSASVSGDGTATAYISLVSVVMDLALLWAINHLHIAPPTIREAYYQGTAAIVPFMLVVLVLTIELIPLSIGAWLLGTGLAPTVAIQPVEKLLIGLVGASLATPSLWWLSRDIFGIFHVLRPNTRPVQALKASRQAVKGRTWLVMGRLIILVLAMLALISVPSVLLVWAHSVHQQTFYLSILQLIVSLTVLPLTFIYLHQLNLELAK